MSPRWGFRVGFTTSAIYIPPRWGSVFRKQDVSKFLIDFVDLLNIKCFR